MKGLSAENLDVPGMSCAGKNCKERATPIPFTDHCIRGATEGFRCKCGKVLTEKIIR